MLTKYARANILDVRQSDERISASELTGDRFRKLAKPMADSISPDGYLYVRTRAISSRVNKNNDGWPSEELAKAYSTFDKRPIFVDHHNDDPDKARGVVVWSKLHVEDEKTAAALDPYYAKSPPENHMPPTWIELMLEVDAESFPKLAKGIIDGDIDAVSMGANIELSKCSVCDNEAETPQQYCSHVQHKGATFEVESSDGTKTHKKAYEDCYGVNFFEISFVFDPADETALVSDMSAEREAAIQSVASLRAAGAPVPQELLAQAEGLVKAASKKEAIGPSDREQQKPQRNVNYEPQSEMLRAPQDVDTLRPDVTCKQCGAEMEEDSTGHFSCPQCGWELEPEGLDNPDVEMAKNVDLRQDNTEEVNPDGQMETELEHDKGETELQPKSPIQPVAPISSVSDPVIHDMKFADVEAAFEANPKVVSAIVEYMEKNSMEVDDEAELTRILNEDEEFEFAPTLFDSAEAIEASIHKHSPGHDHVDSWSDKRNRQYEHVLETCKKEHPDYDLDRCKELAARTVNKERSEKGETKDSAADTQPTEKKVVLDQGKPVAAPSQQAKGERVKSDQFAPVETKTTVLADSGTESVESHEDTMTDTKTADRETIVRTEEDGSGVVRTEEITKEYGPMGGGSEEDSPKAEGEGEESNPKAEGESDSPTNDEPVADDSATEGEGSEAEGDQSSDDSTPSSAPLAEEEKVPAMASVNKESKLMAALKLAKLASSLGVISSDDELPFAGRLEDEETMEQIEARFKMLEQVREAGLARRRKPVVAGRVPSFSSFTASHRSDDELDNLPDEAAFL